MAEDLALRVLDLDAHYKDFQALWTVSLDVKKGEVVSIIGANGAGKSTLLNTISGLLTPTRGTIEFLGKEIGGLAPHKTVAEGISLVPEGRRVFPRLTVYENLEIPLSYRNVKRKDRQAIVGDALDRFQIVGKKDLYPSQLSGGQQQMVAVARAVIAEPKVILADEPTGSLHTSQGKMIMELLKKLNDEGTTIIQVTHNEAWAAYGSKIVNLEDGWMVS